MTTIRARLACILIAGALSVAHPAPAAKNDSLSAAAGRTSRGDNSAVLVIVNGARITENQLTFYRLIHRIPDNPPPETRKRLVEQLVENELMRGFLANRRADVDSKSVNAAVDAIKGQLRRQHLDPETTLRGLGYTQAGLRRELTLPLAWERHLGRVLTTQSIRDEFQRHRAEYDGTEVRASQVFLKVPASDSGPKVKQAEEKLARIRSDIAAGKLSFAQAARQFSEAPSASAGGEVGYFPFHGKMPPEVCKVAFSLQPGEISQPFRTSFGVHLYEVTDRRAGNSSLEDVRSQVIRRLAKQLWDEFVTQERAKATIEWRTGSS